MSNINQFNINQDCFSELAYLGAIYITGKDTQQFLQGQLTCDMRQLRPTLSLPAAYCNIQGRVIANFIVIPWYDGVLLLMPREIIAATLTLLKKYAAFSKVSITDESSVLHLLGFIGKTVTTTLLYYFSSVPNDDYAVQDNDTTALIQLPGKRYLTVSSTLSSSLVGQQLAQVNSNVWHYLQLLQGIPDIYAATQEKLLPHRINLPQLNAISFDKGCYLGQEIIARTHYKAKLKHQLYAYYVATSEPLHPADLLYSSDGTVNIGEIVDCALAPDGSYLILATMLIDFHNLSECFVNQQRVRLFQFSRALQGDPS